MADGTRVNTELVAWWRRGLIALAVLTAAGGSAWALAHADPGLAVGYAAWVAVPVAPLIFVRDGRGFRVACTAVAVGLLVFAVFFAVFGAFVVAPTALVVLAAGRADRGRLRKVVLGTTSLAIAVLSLVGWTIVDVQAFRPYHASAVRLDEHGYTDTSDTATGLRIGTWVRPGGQGQRVEINSRRGGPDARVASGARFERR